MRWLEVSVTVDHEAAEAVSEVLSRYVHQGVALDVEEEQATVRGYLAADEELAARRRKIEEAIWHLGQIWPIPEPTFRVVDDEEWISQWKRTISVLHLTPHLVIKPSWKEYAGKEGEVVLEMDPGLAFGTGLHPTTQLCARALQEYLRPGMRVLDLGTGTGILALAAAKLGAARVDALDIDATAVTVARRNALANGVAGTVRVREGSLADVSATYDLILVNILTRVIIAMDRAGLAERLAPGARVVVSGVLAEQATEVVEALEEEGLAFEELFQRDDWTALAFRRAA
jgi:ribosomal protein L11 methyltransferase